MTETTPVALLLAGGLLAPSSEVTSKRSMSKFPLKSPVDRGPTHGTEK
jgi:hypothetical protein